MNHQLAISSDLAERAEQTCWGLLHAEIDVAFTFLRIAVMAAQADAAPRAVQAQEKAILLHKSVVSQLGCLPLHSQQERLDLELRAHALLEAIVSAEQQFRILAGMPSSCPPTLPDATRPEPR